MVYNLSVYLGVSCYALVLCPLAVRSAVQTSAIEMIIGSLQAHTYSEFCSWCCCYRVLNLLTTYRVIASRFMMFYIELQ